MFLLLLFFLAVVYFCLSCALAHIWSPYETLFLYVFSFSLCNPFWCGNMCLFVLFLVLFTGTVKWERMRRENRHQKMRIDVKKERGKCSNCAELCEVIVKVVNTLDKYTVPSPWPCHVRLFLTQYCMIAYMMIGHTQCTLPLPHISYAWICFGIGFTIDDVNFWQFTTHGTKWLTTTGFAFILCFFFYFYKYRIFRI